MGDPEAAEVALLVELLSLEKPTQPLLVATTHLAWGEDAEELRLKQVGWADGAGNPRHARVKLLSLFALLVQW